MAATAEFNLNTLTQDGALSPPDIEMGKLNTQSMTGEVKDIEWLKGQLANPATPMQQKTIGASRMNKAAVFAASVMSQFCLALATNNRLGNKVGDDGYGELAQTLALNYATSEAVKGLYQQDRQDQRLIRQPLTGLAWAALSVGTAALADAAAFYIKGEPQSVGKATGFAAMNLLGLAVKEASIASEKYSTVGKIGLGALYTGICTAAAFMGRLSSDAVVKLVATSGVSNMLSKVGKSMGRGFTFKQSLALMGSLSALAAGIDLIPCAAGINPVSESQNRYITALTGISCLTNLITAWKLKKESNKGDSVRIGLEKIYQTLDQNHPAKLPLAAAVFHRLNDRFDEALFELGRAKEHLDEKKNIQVAKAIAELESLKSPKKTKPKEIVKSSAISGAFFGLGAGIVSLGSMASEAILGSPKTPTLVAGTTTSQIGIGKMLVVTAGKKCHSLLSKGISAAASVGATFGVSSLIRFAPSSFAMPEVAASVGVSALSFFRACRKALLPKGYQQERELAALSRMVASA
jgi:hypothetical protein